MDKVNKEIIDKILIKQKQGIKLETSTLNIQLTDYQIQTSALDTFGDILYTNNNKYIYRGIRTENFDKFKELYETGILQTLAEYQLIPQFKISNYALYKYSLILEIEKLQIIHPCYWSFTMLKDEAILKLRLIEILNYFGYGLIDGHSFNSTFKEGKPVFFDFGSFKKGKDNTVAKVEIIKSNILPLIMMSLGNSYFARYALMGDDLEKIIPVMPIEASFEAQTAIKKFSNYKNFLQVKNVTNFKKIQIADVEKLFDFENIYKDTKTLWGEYYVDKNINEKPVERFSNVINKINKYCSDCKTFIDIAGNKGYLAYWVKNNTNIKKVISTDYDTFAVESGIKLFKDKGISFCLLNCMFPFLHPEAFKSDVVCAMAVTHHLILTQKLNIDYILQSFKKYTGKYIFVEFCPLGMYTSDCVDEKPVVPDFYTTEWFEENFKKYFDLIEKETIAEVKIKDVQYPHRILFIGKVKEEDEA